MAHGQSKIRFNIAISQERLFRKPGFYTYSPALLERVPAPPMSAGQESVLLMQQGYLACFMASGRTVVTVIFLITSVPHTSPATQLCQDPERTHAAPAELFFGLAEEGLLRPFLNSFTTTILLRTVSKALQNSSKNISRSLPRPPGYFTVDIYQLDQAVTSPQSIHADYCI